MHAYYIVQQDMQIYDSVVQLRRVVADPKQWQHETNKLAGHDRANLFVTCLAESDESQEGAIQFKHYFRVY